MNYFERIQRSLDFIEENLKNGISVPDAAREACLSLYHFHRVFHALTGDTAGDYIRKRRLASAAYDLLKTGNRILDIALDYRFESQEAFTRSFHSHYGLTPGRYRREKSHLILDGKMVLEGRRSVVLKGGIMMEPKIIEKNAFRIAGVELRTSPDENRKNRTIPSFWMKMNQDKTFWDRLGKITSGKAALGVCTDFDGKDFSYWIAMEIPESATVPEGLLVKDIPSQRYAVFTAKGQVPQSVWETLDYIYGEWFPHSGHERFDGPDIEWYDERYNPATGSGEVDLYIPIK